MWPTSAAKALQRSCIGDLSGVTRSRTSSYRLPTLNFRDTLRAAHPTRRWAQLVAGLLLAASSVALMVEARLGLDPWNALHEGLAERLPLSFGTVAALSGLVVLLLWVPLRQPLGAGTVVNTVLVGLLIDVALWVVPTPQTLVVRGVFLLVGVVLCGAAGAVYLGSHLGPGPRDGLMTGLVARTGRSVRLVRTTLELTVLLAGYLLGGTVGIGTVLFAVAIGPLVQFFLPRVAAPLEMPVEPASARHA
jgi:uncharacterized membrane protein YczE